MVNLPQQSLSSGVSAVVPVYNSAETLALLVTRIEAVAKQLPTENFELILVNDGSRDQSWAMIEGLVSAHDWVRGINMMRNYGQHNALLAGILAAQFDVVVTLDDDLQNPPEEIPTLLAELNKGYDVVYGSPAVQKHSLLRSMASQFTKLALQQTMGVQIASKVHAYRAFRTILRNAFAHYHSPFVSIDVLLTWGTTRFTYVTVRQDPRAVGQTQYTLDKLVTHALNMITGFSTLPLQLASIIGFSFALFGFGVLAYVIIIAIVMDSPQGFPFLASVIAIFSGMQMFALGIIGEYLARIHFNTMGRGPGVVRQRIGFE